MTVKKIRPAFTRSCSGSVDSHSVSPNSDILSKASTAVRRDGACKYFFGWVKRDPETYVLVCNGLERCNVENLLVHIELDSGLCFKFMRNL